MRLFSKYKLNVSDKPQLDVDWKSLWRITTLTAKTECVEIKVAVTPALTRNEFSALA
jgi:hypothetical protein